MRLDNFKKIFLVLIMLVLNSKYTRVRILVIKRRIHTTTYDIASPLKQFVTSLI